MGAGPSAGSTEMALVVHANLKNFISEIVEK